MTKTKTGRVQLELPLMVEADISTLIPATDPSIAVFSPCRKYRYTLWRKWADDWQTNYVQFIGLNPSTADEVQDDPTVRRCIQYSKDWGYSALCMTNIFAFRATDPRDMKAVDEPIGQDNDRHLLEIAKGAGIIIAAWGNHGRHRDRWKEVVDLLPDMHCLKITQAGMPSHPLYIPRNVSPIPYDLSK